MNADDEFEFETTAERMKKRKVNNLRLDQEIDELKHRTVKEYAKEELEQLYNDEFPMDNPPDCYTRYESEVSLGKLSESVLNIYYEDTQNEDVDVNSKVQQSKAIIDVMATYGELSEHFIATLTKGQVHPDVRIYATETLHELRTEKTESKSLTEAIRDWWQGE